MPLFEPKIEKGKITYMTQGGELGPPCPCYDTFERRGDVIVGYGDGNLIDGYSYRQVPAYTFELSPVPKPEFVTSMLEMYEKMQPK